MYGIIIYIKFLNDKLPLSLKRKGQGIDNKGGDFFDRLVSVGSCFTRNS